MERWIFRIMVLGAVVLSAALWALAETDNTKYLFSIQTGETAYGYFGSAVLGAVDWTGIGKKYIAIGASGATTELAQRGTVYFYDKLGAAAPVMILDGLAKGDLFGRRLSGKSDMNGDGIPDLVVAAPYWQTSSQKSGKVYLYLGGEGFPKSKPIILSAGEAGDGFGSSVCLEGDLNGDNFADLIVGAPYSNRNGPLAGRAYIWWGSKDIKSEAKPDVILRQGTTNDLFGSCLALGDLNGDGQADLAVGAPQHNIGEKIPGSVFIYYGGSNTKWQQSSMVVSGEGTTFHDHFGASIAIVKDINGDGANDLLIGAPKVEIYDEDQGRVYLFWGGQALDKNPDQIFNGEEPTDLFGSAIYGVGDLNKDGKGDFVIQAENAARAQGILYFYYGGWERAFYELTGEGVGDRLGGCLDGLGDMNADGTEDVIIGARWNDAGDRDAGRIYILSFPH